MGLNHVLRGTIAPVCIAVGLLLGIGGCGKQLEEENTQLKQRVETLDLEVGRLKRDVEVKDKKISGLMEQIAQADATLAAVQLGVSAPSDQLIATLKTNHGDIVVELDWKQTPKTVQNFVGLAEGTKEFKDPNTGTGAKRPFFNGLSFHRVIPGFMIQGGDPNGNGTGGPGYTFADEIVEGSGFEKPGLLAMANRGPNTNGSQFFLTTGTPTYLNGKHTIFGKVIKGMEVVEAISKVKTAAQDKPLEPVIINEVVVSRQKASSTP